MSLTEALGLASNSDRAGTNVPVAACGDALRGEGCKWICSRLIDRGQEPEGWGAFPHILPAWPAPSGAFDCQVSLNMQLGIGTPLCSSCTYDWG